MARKHRAKAGAGDEVHVRIGGVREIRISSDEIVAALLSLGRNEQVFVLDSCGVRHLGSHLLVAGLRPVETLELSRTEPQNTLQILDEKLSGDRAAIFTISYDFGLKLQNIESRNTAWFSEPDVFLATFESLIVHDYRTGRSFLAGDAGSFSAAEKLLARRYSQPVRHLSATSAASNFSRLEYLSAIEEIKEYIRRGDTYQTNLTQQLRVSLPKTTGPENIFWRLRRDHPAPFAAFINRSDSTVVSASPERFFKVSTRARRRDASAFVHDISASPIKGTRGRGATQEEDLSLKNELLGSEKDRAENTMIVDLLRNDLGRVCEFGSVRVEGLCEIEEHPTLFHLVSTICGELRNGVGFPEILPAVFPCGSITGAPKISTMRIIDELETASRGLSMGTIGCYLPESFRITDSIFDLNVAIRTMVVREGTAVFNVGGGITIDSDPEKEYEETLLKAKALLRAAEGRFESPI